MILASSFAPPVEHQFEGFFYHDSDYVAGAEGLQEFKLATGQDVEAGLDGRYAFSKELGSGWEFGTDSRGLSRLFYYHQRDIWAVSSSLAQLVDHLREHRVPLHVNYPHLSTLGARHSFTTQLSSLDTLFTDIRLAPSFAQVVIRHGALSLQFLPTQSGGTYDDALSKYVSTWRARLDTLLADDRVRLKFDLSGGVDSRTVLAFALSSPYFDPQSGRHVVISAETKTDDFSAAQNIASDFSIKLNEGRYSAPAVRDENGAYRTWRDYSLGAYLPAYLPQNRFNPLNIHGHGAGGGNNRHIYGDQPVADYLDRFKTRVPAHYFDEWRSSVLDSLDLISAHRPDVPPSILHYREFRNRFHFGHRPHSEAVYTPVNSVLMDAVTDGRDGLEDRQVFFDVMESLVPGLIDYPYDTDSKAPGERIKSRIRTVEVRDPVMPGRVYAAGPVDSSPGAPSSQPAYARWFEECTAAVGMREVRSFLGPEATARCDEAIHTSKKSLGAFHPASLDLSYARTLAFVLKP